MGSSLRKCVVGLLSFGALAGVFAVYMHFNQTSIPSLQDLGEPNQLLSDPFPEQSAKVGDIDVIAFEKPVFMDRDETGRIIRQWGFEELWSKGGNVLEVSQPFMNLYLDDLTCDITAENGRLRQETGHRGQFPKDIAFSGNVVIHITPEPNSFDEEIFIYLDDISFVSEKSVFSSTRDIRVASDTVQLTGRGMEFVYSQLAQRIQYFKLLELGELRIKTPKDKLFPDSSHLARSQPEPAPSEPNWSEAIEPSTDADPNQAGQALQAQYYDCVLHQNVTLRTPRELIFARERVTLTDIFLPKSSGLGLGGQTEQEKPLDTAAASAGGDPNTDPNTAELAPPEFVDVTVNCDNGILLLPQNAPFDVNLPPAQTSASPDPNVTKALGHAGFVSQAITHSLLQRDTQADGPLEFTFYADDANAPTLQERLVPIKVTAQKYGTYEADADRIVFAGDCLCTLIREDPNVIDRYSLEAQTIGIDLADTKDSQSIASAVDLKHMEAYGGVVRLGVYTRTRAQAYELLAGREPQAGDLLAGAELECQRFACDPNSGQEVFTATGPGNIRFNNARADEADREVDPNAPQTRACYAFLEGFETLQFFVAENRIIALASDNRMQFEYFPIVDGQSNQRIYAEAKYVEIELVKTYTGKLGLSRLTALGDVYYEDDGKDKEEKQFFSADGVSYDHRLSTLRMWSDMDEPCMVNGMPVKGIQYNLKTSDLQTELIGPVMIPVP